MPNFNKDASIASLLPISDKNIYIMAAAIVAVTTENQFFAIMTKHWECIKSFITTYLLETFPINIGDVHIKRKAHRVFMITAENNMLAIW